MEFAPEDAAEFQPENPSHSSFSPSLLFEHTRVHIHLSDCETYNRFEGTNIQDVHKVSLQFEKFITKATEKTDKWKLL